MQHCKRLEIVESSGLMFIQVFVPRRRSPKLHAACWALYTELLLRLRHQAVKLQGQLCVLIMPQHEPHTAASEEHADRDHESNDSMDEEDQDQLSITSDPAPAAASKQQKAMEPSSRKVSSKSIAPLNIKAAKGRIVFKKNGDGGGPIRCRNSWKRSNVEIRTLEGHFFVPMWAPRKLFSIYFDLCL